MCCRVRKVLFFEVLLTLFALILYIYLLYILPRKFSIFLLLQEDIFKIEAMDLGKVTKVKVRHDNSGLQSSWYLDKVVIMEAKVCLILLYYFKCMAAYLNTPIRGFDLL